MGSREKTILNRQMQTNEALNYYNGDVVVFLDNIVYNDINIIIWQIALGG